MSRLIEAVGLELYWLRWLATRDAYECRECFASVRVFPWQKCSGCGVQWP